MASDKNLVDFIVDQIENTGMVTYKQMFGGYTIYNDGKVVALICGNQLFVKPTEGGRAFIGKVVEAPPYPGAKNCFLIDDKMEDGEWLSDLIRITAKELPDRKPIKRR